MGRKIEIDIDDMLALFRTYGCGGVTPYDIFDIIDDCRLTDIDEYAKMCDDYDTVKEDIIEMFMGYTGDKMMAAMRVREGV